jgi:hypothetical protein
VYRRSKHFGQWNKSAFKTENSVNLFLLPT